MGSEIVIIMQPTVVEQRTLPRRRVLKGAIISAKRVHFRAECTVRNLSEHGACLALRDATFVPIDFDLTFNDGTVWSCRIIWRSANRLGIAFENG